MEKCRDATRTSFPPPSPTLAKKCTESVAKAKSDPIIAALWKKVTKECKHEPKVLCRCFDDKACKALLGFYDPNTDAVYINTALGEEGVKEMLKHELTHNLQKCDKRLPKKANDCWGSLKAELEAYRAQNMSFVEAFSGCCEKRLLRGLLQARNERSGLEPTLG